jgi:hypothetical protein
MTQFASRSSFAESAAEPMGAPGLEQAAVKTRPNTATRKATATPELPNQLRYTYGREVFRQVNIGRFSPAVFDPRPSLTASVSAHDHGIDDSRRAEGEFTWGK